VSLGAASVPAGQRKKNGEMWDEKTPESVVALRGWVG
jgi:hypothetical protein